jgi:Ca2+-binding EF-hand superfamily protein
VKAIVNPPGEHSFYVPPDNPKHSTVRDELRFQLQKRYGSVDKAFETMTEMSCKVMNKDEFTRVLQNLLGVSTDYAAKAFSELDEGRKGYVDLSDLHQVPLLESLRLQLFRLYGTESRAYSTLTSQEVTLLTKKEFTGFLTTYLQFPTESAKTLDGDVSRGAEQIFQELDETHSGVVDLAKLPERTIMDRLRAEIALKHGSLPQAWAAINLFDSSQLRELMLLTPQSISSVVFDGVRKIAPGEGMKAGREHLPERTEVARTAALRGNRGPADIARHNLTLKYSTLDKAFAAWEAGNHLGRRDAVKIFEQLLGCSRAFASDLFTQVANKDDQFEVHSIRPQTALEELRLRLAMRFRTLDRAYVSLTGESPNTVKKPEFIDFLRRLLATDTTTAGRAFFCALGRTATRAKSQAIDLRNLRGATWEEEMLLEQQKVKDKEKLGRGPERAHKQKLRESAGRRPADSLRPGSESPRSWAQRKALLPEQRKPRAGVYDDDPRPRERWPGAMRTELTLPSSAWRPLGEKMASNAGFYSFPRTATLRDFQPRDEKEKNGMSITRLPSATAQIFLQTPSNVGPGSYEQMHTLADRVGKVDTFTDSSLPHGHIDGQGNPHGDLVTDEYGELMKARPPVLQARSGVGGMMQKNSTRGGSISKEFAVRARNLSGVRNRDKRFRDLHPSLQDVQADPPPAVGTYEPTVGKIAEHKVDPTGANSIKDKSWRYEFSVGGSTGCWRNRNTVGFWDMPRKQLMQYEKARASYDLVDLAES